jgi:hypothetical protein
MDEVGAMDVFGSAFCGGTRSEAAAEGGGRINPFPGRGGAGMAPKDGGFRRGGLEDLTTIAGKALGGFSSSMSTDISGMTKSLVLNPSVSMVGTLGTTGGAENTGACSFAWIGDGAV